MSLKSIFLCSVFVLMLAGCSIGSVKPESISVCKTLNDNDEWIVPLLRAEQQFTTPISTQLSLLEFPLSGRGGKFVYARAGDWDEFRMRTEHWHASPDSLEDAINYAAWFSQQSRERNNLDRYAAGEHFLAIRLGHGAYHRMDKGSLPELEKQSLYIAERAKRWRKQLDQCRQEWADEGWLKSLKFW